MAKKSSVFVCQQCGNESIRWLGRCPVCGEWNTLVETVVSTDSKKQNRNSQTTKAPVALQNVEIGNMQRVSTKIEEFDRILGGGMVKGQVVLLAGVPGIGKSTILLQVAANMGKVLYVSGEESVSQIKIRAERLGVKGKIDLMEETDVDNIVASIGEDYEFVVIDSIQTLKTEDLNSVAGSIGQVRECAGRIVRVAKSLNVPIVIVGHVTKEGTVAGPSTLAHIVDSVCWFEGEQESDVRLINVIKNRFGPSNEVGVFEMGEKGLTSLGDMQKLFLTQDKAVSGTAVGCVMAGARPILAEIQSLVVPTYTPYPRRIAHNIDSKKLELILAILMRRCKLPLQKYDVFINVAGGLTVSDPAADLAIALSVASAFWDKPLGEGTVAIGEIALTGQIREARMLERRTKYAKSVGFNKVLSSAKYKDLGRVISEFFRQKKSS